MTKDKLEEKHICDNINCNHNNTEGLCLMFNPDVCKYRQLQKEYTELEKSCDETQELLDKQIEATYKLDKENAELKEKLKPENCLKLLAKEGYIKFTSDNLTKAKEKIRNLLEIIERPYQFNAPEKIQMVKEAEQFLSEAEK